MNRYHIRGVKMMNKKTVAIFVLLVLLTIAGIGWLKTALETSPLQNTYNWPQLIPGYEVYLDRKIHLSIMEGSSMAPTINDGDTVLWVEVDNMAELKVGDIIIFKHPTIPHLDNIAHRIIEVEIVGEEYRFRTKGDNLSEPDRNIVPEGNVHGLVIGVIYKGSS
jgi:signal peptidase I